MRKTSLLALVTLLALGGFATGVAAQQTTPVSVPVPAGAQPFTPPEQPEQARGLVVYQRFEGSNSSQGLVMQLTSTVGYNFNKYFGVDVGAPFYFISATKSKTGTRSTNGVGDFFADARLTLSNPVVNYASTVTITAPTGSSSDGLSTGEVTWDWSNNFDREFGRFTPFLEAGLGNSVSNPGLVRGKELPFGRPFTTLGKIAHFEAGTSFNIWRSLSFSASAYEILPWGQQTVFSRFIPAGSVGGPSRKRRAFEQQPQTVGGADLTRDNGYNTSLSLSPVSYMEFTVGYTRSIPLHLDTVTFGVGVNVTRLFRTARGTYARADSDSKEQKGGGL